MIIFPGLLGSIAATGKTAVVVSTPLTYTASITSPTIDNRSSFGGIFPPTTITLPFTISATGTGTETLTISVIDYSGMGDSITVSFNEFSQVNTTGINGGSSVGVYIKYTDNGSNFSPQSADLYFSSSGGNSPSPNPISIVAYPYNSF